jgi:hypothetical protein
MRHLHDPEILAVIGAILMAIIVVSVMLTSDWLRRWFDR